MAAKAGARFQVVIGAPYGRSESLDNSETTADDKRVVVDRDGWAVHLRAGEETDMRIPPLVKSLEPLALVDRERKVDLSIGLTSDSVISITATPRPSESMTSRRSPTGSGVSPSRW